MKNALFVCLVALMAACTCCQCDGPCEAQTIAEAEIDRAEVIRRGNTVEHIEPGIGTYEGSGDWAALPEDDSGKWFVTVIKMQGCGACVQLMRDWQRSPDLLAFANPAEPKQSWAHFNVYDRADKSQMWRYEKLHISQFPTILIQPPRNGQYGPARTIVFQNTYHGSPKELASQMRAAIQRYVDRLNDQQYEGPIGATENGVTEDTVSGTDDEEPAKPVEPTEAEKEPAEPPGMSTIEIAPPWNPAPEPEPYSPVIRPPSPWSPQPDVAPVVIPPEMQRPKIEISLPFLSEIGRSFGMLFTLIVIGVLVWLVLQVRKNQGGSYTPPPAPPPRYYEPAPPTEAPTATTARSRRR